MNIINKKAKFNFDFIEIETSGIVLFGSEIKSIRENKIAFNDSYCYFKNNEIWIKNLHISEYEKGTINNHEPKRDRKLLLTKKQIKKYQSKVNEKGLTIIPIEIFINEKGIAKLKIALAKGKKLYDKKDKILKKDDKIQIKNKYNFNIN